MMRACCQPLKKHFLSGSQNNRVGTCPTATGAVPVGGLRVGALASTQAPLSSEGRRETVHIPK